MIFSQVFGEEGDSKVVDSDREPREEVGPESTKSGGWS